MGYRVVTNSLQHHGIQGMHWGDRNGPPYPLGTKTHNRIVNRDKADKKRNKDDEQVHNRFHLSDNKKKAIKVGAAIVGTAIVAYGGYRLVKSGKLNSLVNLGKRSLSGAGGFNNTSNTNNMRTLDIIKTNIEGINPNKNYENSKFILKASDGKPLFTVNCQACSLAYELRARGKNAVAKLVDTREFNSELLLKKIYKNPDIKKIDRINNWTELDGILTKLGDGARGNLSFPIEITLPDGTPGVGKHSIAFEIINGQLALIDGQIEKGFGSNSPAFDVFYKALKNDIKYCRTDNLELNQIDFIEKLVLTKIK